MVYNKHVGTLFIIAFVELLERMRDIKIEGKASDAAHLGDSREGQTNSGTTTFMYSRLSQYVIKC